MTQWPSACGAAAARGARSHGAGAARRFGPGAGEQAPWLCAAGGHDVWFLYGAGAAGTLRVDAWGNASYGEILDDNASCGALASRGCNYDAGEARPERDAERLRDARSSGAVAARGCRTGGIGGPIGHDRAARWLPRETGWRRKKKSLRSLPTGGFHWWSRGESNP